MKKFLIVLLAAGGLLIATAAEASAAHCGRGYGSRGLSFRSYRAYPRSYGRYSYGRLPVRRGFSLSIGSGYYGSRFSGGYVPSYSYGRSYGGYCY